MALAIVEVRGVTVQFDRAKVLDSVSLELNRGEALALIGPNGAGKTTLLKVLGGLLTPTTGEVLFRGKEIGEETVDDLRRHATMVFQKPVLFGTTVFKNVAYGLRVRGLSEQEVRERTLEALKLVRMEEYVDRQARSLSGGEQKRVTLAMSIVIEPEILLLDEPTSYLDSEGVRIVEEFIRTVKSQKQTAIVVATHDLLQAVRMTENTALIEAGRLGAIGPSTRLVREELESIAFSTNDYNVFHGVAENGMDSGRRLVKIRLDEAVMIEALAEKVGPVTVRIPPEDIVVSREPVLSSAKNTLRGTVKHIEIDDSIVRLTIDVGIDLVVIITRSSLDTLNVREEDMVYATFKASSVRVY
ncbi:MAG: ABC transporter ATP-binding protein [Candidatus Thorarchaeota archaeon]